MPIFECSRCNELTYSASRDAVHACARCGSVSHRVVEGGFDEARRSGRTLGGGDHAALVFDDPAAIAPFCARYLTEGVEAGERVLAGVTRGVRDATRELLAADVDGRIEWEEPRALYADFDAGRVAAMYESMIGGEQRRTRILAGLDRECAEGVEPDELDRYERVAHAIITKHGATVVCLYDTTALPDDLVEIAERRHTLSVRDGAVRRSERFEYEPV